MVLVQQRCLFCFFVRRAGLGEGRGRGRIWLVQNREEAERLRVADPERLFWVTQTTLSVDDTAEIARLCGARAELLDDPSALSEEWLRGVATVGVTAGASTPESLVDDLLAALRTLGGEVAGEIGDIVETQSFALPGVLRGRPEG